MGWGSKLQIPGLGEIFRLNDQPLVPKDLDKTLIGTAQAANRLYWKVKADQAYADALPLYGAEVAEQVHKAVLNRRDPGPILARAAQLIHEREDRERLLKNPPPVHGSARFATASEAGSAIRSRAALLEPTSMLLGTVLEHGQARGQVYWDADDGHLLTIAASRAGKGHSVIIPNLLRYQGSCVILDPKGELYELTSKHRRTFGKVYRLAPLDDGKDETTSAWRRDAFNPLALIRSPLEARNLAQALLPKDPKSAEFFNKDAVAFLTSLFLYVVLELPPPLRNMAAVIELLEGTNREFREDVLEVMAASVHDSVRSGAQAVLDKASRTNGDPFAAASSLRETLRTDMAIWSTPSVLEALHGDTIDFRRLKDETVTVYIDVPFNQMGTYAPVLRVILQSALDGMVLNRRVARPHVLFLIDEFLALHTFDAYRQALNTHGGYGVRFWYFVQEVASLRTEYPGEAWRTFFNASVKQYFGIRDDATAAELSKALGTCTVAQRNVSESGSLSAPIGYDQGQSNYGSSVTESVSLFGRPLRTPDEVQRDLAPWRGRDHRGGYVRSDDNNTWLEVEMYGYQHASWDGFFTRRIGTLLKSDDI